MTNLWPGIRPGVFTSAMGEVPGLYGTGSRMEDWVVH